MSPPSAGQGSGAEALRRALAAPGNGGGKRRPAPTKERAREDAIVEAAFKLLEAPIKGWIRARVRSGSSALESVADLSQILSAGQSVLTAAGTVLAAVRSVQKVGKK
jgi:hypothetical protein